MTDIDDLDDIDDAPAVLPVPEAAAASPWALIALAVGAITAVVLWRRRSRA
ncbi:hypothetical protein [Actinoplanes sp. NPDC049802]|uniref:hypothetical protein n=1 Tax=Actinoplanes sp. NPDC049802 TaxID=3154742 RepID=UPI0033DECDF3